jgi:hypothetical protein
MFKFKVCRFKNQNLLFQILYKFFKGAIKVSACETVV